MDAVWIKSNQKSEAESKGYVVIAPESVLATHLSQILNKFELLQSNVENIKFNELEDKYDFVIGGPPCQAFSVFGKRKGLEDPRGNLVYEYARIIKELKPEGFLFENGRKIQPVENITLAGNFFDIFQCYSS